MDVWPHVWTFRPMDVGRNVYGRFSPRPWGKSSTGESPMERNVHGAESPDTGCKMSDVCVCVEAGSVVLQKLLVTKGVPKNCAFIGIDQNGRLCPVTYVSYYQRLFAL